LALIALTKPRIIEFLLVTTVPTMLLAARGLPSWRLVIVTLVGGTLAAGSANTINCYLDRDNGAVMKRTSRRPLVSKRGVGPASLVACLCVLIVRFMPVVSRRFRTAC
jgi:protoheme IX farnesyltransferase